MRFRTYLRSGTNSQRVGKQGRVSLTSSCAGNVAPDRTEACLMAVSPPDVPDEQGSGEKRAVGPPQQFLRPGRELQHAAARASHRCVNPSASARGTGDAATVDAFLTAPGRSLDRQPPWARRTALRSAAKRQALRQLVTVRDLSIKAASQRQRRLISTTIVFVLSIGLWLWIISSIFTWTR